MITGYAINAESYYIPLHLNIVFNSGCDFDRDYPDDSIIEEILHLAYDSEYKYFLIDMRRVRTVGYIYDKLGKEFLSGSKVLIFDKPSDILRGKLRNDFVEYLEMGGPDIEFLSSSAGIGYFASVLNAKDKLNENLRAIKISMIGDLLKKSATFKNEYLESSNIYANSYFNVKALFGDVACFRLVIYDLCCNISDYFPDANAILCVSNNGAALSAVIGKILRKPVIYLMNLGPHITLKDAKVIEKISSGEKLVFVYDFICLGTEFKITRMVARMRGAEVLGGTGVASHLKVPKVVNHPFMRINTDYDFGYELSIYPVTEAI